LQSSDTDHIGYIEKGAIVNVEEVAVIKIGNRVRGFITCTDPQVSGWISLRNNSRDFAEPLGRTIEVISSTVCQACGVRIVAVPPEHCPKCKSPLDDAINIRVRSDTSSSETEVALVKSIDSSHTWGTDLGPGTHVSFEFREDRCNATVHRVSTGSGTKRTVQKKNSNMKQSAPWKIPRLKECG